MVASLHYKRHGHFETTHGIPSEVIVMVNFSVNYMVNYNYVVMFRIITKYNKVIFNEIVHFICEA